MASKTTTRSVLLALVGLLLAGAGCSSSNEGSKCVPGASVACTGQGGCSGAQVCTSDGASFGSCICGANPAADGGGSSGHGSGDGSTGTGCPPCWNDWACLDDYESLDYFAGKRNTDGSCALTVQSLDHGAINITLTCGGQANWASDEDPNGAPAVDFVDGALVLHCDQT